MSTPDPIILWTVRDIHTLACPLCEFTVDVPDVPVSDALGGVFGMSGDTFARVQAERSAAQVSREMTDHLKNHPVTDWLPKLQRPDGVTCSSCRRPRTALDTLDYDPVQVITGAALGWYSGDDGQMCGGCMHNTIRGGSR